ncbi:hypothetical protein FI667_g2917, partial [Globisporangium splendens]
MNMNSMLNYYYEGRTNVPMVSSFSMDISAFSSDLFEYPAAVNQHARGELRNAFVLCWENVLIPTKWLCQRVGLRPTPRGLQEAKERAIANPYLQQSLATVEQCILQLINAVAARGPVYIVSEESVHFVEAMCKTFFPRLAYCLSSPTLMQGVHVVGAPKKFVSVTEKTTWRMNLLQNLVRDRLFGCAPHLLLDVNEGRFGLVVITPHQVDAFACSKTLEIAPFAIPKSVLIANVRSLTLEQFCLHLQTLGQYIHEATPCDTPFAVTL